MTTSSEARVADLHMHTKASDGTVTVDQRIKMAAGLYIDVIAITDHDAINSVLEERFMVDDETGVGVITGAEIKCAVEYEGEEMGIEILGYFLDPDSEEINRILDENSRNRFDRIEEMVSRINSEIDYELEVDEVLEYADGSPGRPHIGMALDEAGVVADVDAAFDEYIGEDCPAYIPTPKIDAEEVIETILEDGSVPVLAHPGRDLERDEADEVVETLADYGLKGLEVQYSWNHKRENNYGISFGEEFSRELSEKYDLIQTGGSDCHGPGDGKNLMGTVEVDYEQVRKLAEEAGAEIRL